MGNPVVQPLDLHALSREELIELVEAGQDGRIRIDFSGKANARKLARRVRPRTLRPVKKYSGGDLDQQARNLLVEGDNLQAMTTLYRERGHVDLILTDPPYNTGSDWRYNDRWEDDPNDEGLGDWVSEDDGARHTKWMRFMWPRLQMMKSMLKPGGVLAICIDHRVVSPADAVPERRSSDKRRSSHAAAVPASARRHRAHVTASARPPGAAARRRAPARARRAGRP